MAVKSTLDELIGCPWSSWPIEDDESPPLKDLQRQRVGSSTPTPSHSPRPPSRVDSDDFMTLPRSDMHIFGQYPALDDFVLVACDICEKAVKMEAFEEHFLRRHVSHQEKMRRLLNRRKCSVVLLKNDIPSSASSQILSPPLKSSPLRIFSKDPESAALLFPKNLNQDRIEESVISPTTIPKLSAKSLTEKPAVVSNVEPSCCSLSVSPSTLSIKSPVSENVGITSNSFVALSTSPSSLTFSDVVISSKNVISIPDTESLPPNLIGSDLVVLMEQKRKSLCLSDKMLEDDKLQITTTSSISSVLRHIVPTTSSVDLSQETSTVSSSYLSLANSTLSPSLAKHISGGNLFSSLRDRKYTPDKHCGVWDADAGRVCTRALSCKVHSVIIKRKIMGRSLPFDELLAKHKAGREAAHNQVNKTRAITTTTLHSNGMIIGNNLSETEFRLSSNEDDTLCYSNGHPKPLAICSYGTQRFGSCLFISDRSLISQRKVYQNGFSAFKSPQQSTSGKGFQLMPNQYSCPSQSSCGSSFLPSFACDSLATGVKLGLPLKRSSSIMLQSSAGATNSVTAYANVSAPTANFRKNSCERISTNFMSTSKRYNSSVSVSTSGNRTGGVNLSMLQSGAGVLLTGGGFNAGIQDFKGGIKFEYGRKIHHILPSESEFV